MVADLAAPGADTLTCSQLEERVQDRGRELLRLLLQDHLDLRAVREVRLESVTGADGVWRRGVERGHGRQLATLFGRVRVERLAYRAAGVGNLHPADAALNLPKETASHTLRKLAASEAVRGSFDAAHQAVGAATGAGVGKRQLEQLTVRAAVDIDAFYASRCPEPATDATVLVLSVDGKGVVMRPEALREHTARAAAAAKGSNRYRTRLASGEKLGRKRMATLGAGAGQAIARRPGPTARGKWLTGSVHHTSAEVITQVFDQAEQRDPTHRRPWVVLVDGARHQLDLIHAEAERRDVRVTIVVDFVHVLEYLWRAAWCFHESGDPAAEDWVAAHARSLLNGRSDQVTAAIRAQAKEADLAGERRHGVETCAGYLKAKQPYLGYDTALAEGWPIATGIIEGACRHLVKDRLDITGARWGLDGAEAVLKLRALHSNGDFDTYFHWHLTQEHRRVHQTRYQHGCSLAA